MKRRIIYIGFVIALLWLWQYYGSTSPKMRMLVSSPQLCFEYLRENGSILFKATITTFIEAIIGLIVATAISFGLMIVCFRFQKFFRFILPLLLTTQVIPLITLAPFFILWLGIGISSKVALAAVLAFYPIFMNFATGYNSISTNIFDLLKIYPSKLAFRIMNVYFPLSLPNIFTGLKIAATLSVIGAIVAEFSGAEIGLGKNLLLSAIRIEPELMMVSIFLSALLGALLFSIIYFIERLSGKWYINEKQLS